MRSLRKSLFVKVLHSLYSSVIDDWCTLLSQMHWSHCKEFFFLTFALLLYFSGRGEGEKHLAW